MIYEHILKRRRIKAELEAAQEADW
jgi:hypothetical protein